jgi:hypothetical protein
VAIEALLCDYIDGTLAEAEHQAVAGHLAECAVCDAMERDARAMTAVFARAGRPEVPDGLVNRILNSTLGAEQQLPAAEPARSRGVLGGWLHSLFAPILQPKLAMGMAMTILSFSMVGRLTGIPQRSLTAEDLNPASVVVGIERKLHRLYDRAMKYYENLRLVHEIQNRLEEWSALEEEESRGRRRPEPLAAPSTETGGPQDGPLQDGRVKP